MQVDDVIGQKRQKKEGKKEEHLQRATSTSHML
jgi:hypothetical protein